MRWAALLLAIATGCAHPGYATRYAAGRVGNGIRDDWHRGLYFAAAAHTVLAPVSFAAVLIGDPAARTPPPESPPAR